MRTLLKSGESLHNFSDSQRGLTHMYIIAVKYIVILVEMKDTWVVSPKNKAPENACDIQLASSKTSAFRLERPPVKASIL